MDFLKLAKVLKPQGLKGELKLEPFTDNPERFYDLSHIYMKCNGEYVCRKVYEGRTYKQFAFIKIEGVGSCEEAEKLRGSFIYLDKESAVKEEGSYFIADLIGMLAKGASGITYGRVKDVFNTGAADIYRVEGEKSLMFPAAPGVIISVDENERIITLDDKKLDEVAVYD